MRGGGLDLRARLAGRRERERERRGGRERGTSTFLRGGRKPRPTLGASPGGVHNGEMETLSGVKASPTQGVCALAAALFAAFSLSLEKAKRRCRGSARLLKQLLRQLVVPSLGLVNEALRFGLLRARKLVVGLPCVRVIRSW